MDAQPPPMRRRYRYGKQQAACREEEGIQRHPVDRTQDSALLARVLKILVNAFRFARIQVLRYGEQYQTGHSH